MKLLVAAAALLVVFATTAQAQRSISLEARTAGELADLCSASPKDERGDAKINFCHGFAQGVIVTTLRSTEGKKPFCFPTPPPTRTATMDGFVSWVKAMPDHRSPSAADGLLRFLGERFPCK